MSIDDKNAIASQFAESASAKLTAFYQTARTLEAELRAAVKAVAPHWDRIEWCGETESNGEGGVNFWVRDISVVLDSGVRRYLAGEDDWERAAQNEHDAATDDAERDEIGELDDDRFIEYQAGYLNVPADFLCAVGDAVTLIGSRLTECRRLDLKGAPELC